MLVGKFSFVTSILILYKVYEADDLCLMKCIGLFCGSGQIHSMSITSKFQYK